MAAGKPDDIPSTPRATGERSVIPLLLAGILLRIIVFANVTPIMPDDHAAVIRSIAEHGSLPTSELLGQSYHPPLYHALMALLLRLTDSTWPVRFCSLLFSVANLCVIWMILRNRSVVPNRTIARLALAIACLQPQLVMYGHFISNDTLTILLGSLLMWLTIRYIERPSISRLIVVAILCGLGMLTKGTFIATGLALLPVVMLIEKRRGNPAPVILGFCAICLALGSYKYVENAVHLGHPIVHNLDFHPDWADPQRGMWRGVGSLLDVNAMELVRSPILVRGAPLSIPLTLYGTFWYPHIPDFALQGNIYGYAWAGSIIFTAAMIPTLLMLIGCLRVRGIVEWAALLLIGSNLAVVLAAGLRYDVWSAFHGRLLMQSFAPMLLMMTTGAAFLWKWKPAR